MIYRPKKIRNSRRGRKITSIVPPVANHKAHRMGTNPPLWNVPHLLFNLMSSTTAPHFDNLEMFALAFLFLSFDRFIAFIVACVLTKSLSLRCRYCNVRGSPEALPAFHPERSIRTWQTGRTSTGPSRRPPNHCDQSPFFNNYSDDSADFQKYQSRRSHDLAIHFGDGPFTKNSRLPLKRNTCVGENSHSLAASAARLHSGTDMKSTDACQCTSDEQFRKTELSVLPPQHTTGVGGSSDSTAASVARLHSGTDTRSTDACKNTSQQFGETESSTPSPQRNTCVIATSDSLAPSAPRRNGPTDTKSNDVCQCTFGEQLGRTEPVPVPRIDRLPRPTTVPVP